MSSQTEVGSLCKETIVSVEPAYNICFMVRCRLGALLLSDHFAGGWSIESCFMAHGVRLDSACLD